MPRNGLYMQCGIQDIQLWLTENWLCLNAPKTDMANIVSSRRSGTIPGITIDQEWIPRSENVKDLGVWFDQGMTMETLVKMVCKAAYAKLYKIGRIRKFLDRKSERFVHALVISRLDTHNAVLYGLPDKTLALGSCPNAKGFKLSSQGCLSAIEI